MKKIIGVILMLLFLIVSTSLAIRLPEVPKERCVEIYGEIAQENCQEIAGKLIEMDKTDGDVRIYLNSPGGYVQWAVPILEVLMTMRNDVQVVTFHQCSSAALPILAVGTKGKRTIIPLTISYIHQVYIERPESPWPHPGMPPEEEEWDEDEWWKKRKENELLRATQIYLDEIFFEHTKVTHKELAEWDDSWIFADAILKYEIADGIYEGEIAPEDWTGELAKDLAELSEMLEELQEDKE